MAGTFNSCDIGLSAGERHLPKVVPVNNSDWIDGVDYTRFTQVRYVFYHDCFSCTSFLTRRLDRGIATRRRRAASFKSESQSQTPIPSIRMHTVL